MTVNSLQPLKANRLSLSAQAQQYLLGLIESGAYEPGEQFPSEADLAAQLGISRPTLREALLNLEQDGVVVRRHGVGTFVALGYGQRLESGLERLESVLQLAGRQGMLLGYNNLHVWQGPASVELCDKLQVPADAEVTRVRRVIVTEELPVAYMEDVIPSSVLSADEINGGFEGSVLDLLRQKLDLEIGQAVADIVALNADEHLAEKLGIEPGQALLMLDEVLFDLEGAAVECSQNYFIPQYCRFHVVRS